MPPSSLNFSIGMTPQGKDRPRFARTNNGAVRTYNTKKTQYAEQMIRVAWIEAGSVTLGEGAIELTIIAYLQRPKNHFRASGQLSAAGERTPQPTKKPDASNIAKLVEDALNGCAWKDDSQVVDLIVKKRWAFFGQDPHIKVVATTL